MEQKRQSAVGGNPRKLWGRALGYFQNLLEPVCSDREQCPNAHSVHLPRCGTEVSGQARVLGHHRGPETVLCKIEPNQCGKGRIRLRLSALRLFYLDAGVNCSRRLVKVEPLWSLRFSSWCAVCFHGGSWLAWTPTTTGNRKSSSRPWGLRLGGVSSCILCTESLNKMLFKK